MPLHSFDIQYIFEPFNRYNDGLFIGITSLFVVSSHVVPIYRHSIEAEDEERKRSASKIWHYSNSEYL